LLTERFINRFYYSVVIMKQSIIMAVLIASIILSWLVIGANLYTMLAGTGGNNPLLGSGNATSYVVGSDGADGNGGAKGNVIEQLFSDRAPEVASPCSRIKASQIFVTPEKIEINFKGAEWAMFTDTNSMDPVLDSDSYALEYVPKSEAELCVGDIASYSPRNADGTIIHRIVEMGSDNEGWYAVFKGDNLPYKDPEKVRFSQIKRVVIGIIY
jgi:hypothetical protein